MSILTLVVLPGSRSAFPASISGLSARWLEASLTEELKYALPASGLAAAQDLERQRDAPFGEGGFGGEEPFGEKPRSSLCHGLGGDANGDAGSSRPRLLSALLLPGVCLSADRLLLLGDDRKGKLDACRDDCCVPILSACC